MSDKSFLDRTATIATILGLPVGVAAAYFAWVAITPKSEDQNPKQEQVVSVDLQPKNVSSSPAQDVKTNPTSTASVEKKDGAQLSCEGVGGDLSAAFVAAKGISLRTHRDDVLVPLSRQALCANNFDLFESIIGEISYRSTKDDALVEGVNFVLSLRRFDLAEKFAKLISYRSTADKVREQIAIAAVKKS